MAFVGQSDSASQLSSPGTDGNGTGVPDNSIINNITNLANSVAADVQQTFARINNPNPPPIPAKQGSMPVLFGMGWVPLLLIGGAIWFVFK